MNKRELVRRIGELGFKFERNGKSHKIYSNGTRKLTIPYGNINGGLVPWILVQAKGTSKRCTRDKRPSIV